MSDAEINWSGGTRWRCQNNHSYDIAKRGYVNLALHHKALSEG